MRYLGGAVLVAAVAITLTACGSQAVQPSATPSITVAPTVTVTATPTPTATPTGTSTAASTTTPTAAAGGNAPANQCPDSDLGVGIYVADGGGGAGSEEFDVLFTNTGGEPCALRGTPSVAVVGGARGPRIGPPAARIQTGAKTLTMQPGESLAAPLRIVNIGTDGGPLVGCTVDEGAGYLVSPPHSDQAFFVKATDDLPAPACASGPSFMTVSPVIRFTD
jgi:hypothetical protein